MVLVSRTDSDGLYRGCSRNPAHFHRARMGAGSLRSGAFGSWRPPLTWSSPCFVPPDVAIGTSPILIRKCSHILPHSTKFAQCRRSGCRTAYAVSQHTQPMCDDGRSRRGHTQQPPNTPFIPRIHRRPAACSQDAPAPRPAPMCWHRAGPRPPCWFLRGQRLAHRSALQDRRRPNFQYAA
jgi:hypothetical protein